MIMSSLKKAFKRIKPKFFFCEHIALKLQVTFLKRLNNKIKIFCYISSLTTKFVTF